MIIVETTFLDIWHGGLIIVVTILGLDEHPYHAHLESLSRSICHLDSNNGEYV